MADLDLAKVRKGLARVQRRADPAVEELDRLMSELVRMPRSEAVRGFLDDLLDLRLQVRS